MTLYDAIGATYSSHRRADPRIAAALLAALGDAATVVNVGAGTGSYEPVDRRVVAVEPSAVLLAQRVPGAAPAVRARAEELPFADGTFDAALAVLTVHHWGDPTAGLRECARVARRRVVILTWDPAATGFWLVEEYFPELLAHDRRVFPALGELARVLGDLDVSVVPIPGDCVDGFLGAFWRRPEAYLDPTVRAGMSSFGRVADVQRGIERLTTDLASGAWAARHEPLRARATLDLGYRLVVSGASSSSG
jgi:SAM-dependent methyltransferase